MAKTATYRFEVRLRAKPGQMVQVIPVDAQFAHVNHRGDLTLTVGSGCTGNCIAGFVSGSWQSFERVNKPE